MWRTLLLSLRRGESRHRFGVSDLGLGVGVGADSACSYYTVWMSSVSVNGVLLNVSEKVLNKRGTIVDSGG